MSEKKKVSEEFHGIVRDAQRNEIDGEAERFQAERRKAAELRLLSLQTHLVNETYRRPDGKPNRSYNASELIGGKSQDELAAELNAELDADDKAVDDALAAKKDTNDQEAQNRFPPPDLTV